MAGDLARIEISNDIIGPLVQAQLQASIVAAMGKSEELLGSVVRTICNSQVDENGKPSTYRDSKPLITWMAEKAIKEAAHEAIKEWFADNRAAIKKETKAALTKNVKGIAERFALGLIELTGTNYRMKIEIKTEQQ